MPSWNDLAQEFEAQAEPLRGPWLMDRLTNSLSVIGQLRGGRTVILYASSFLQKPWLPGPSTMASALRTASSERSLALKTPSRPRSSMDSTPALESASVILVTRCWRSRRLPSPSVAESWMSGKVEAGHTLPWIEHRSRNLSTAAFMSPS